MAFQGGSKLNGPLKYAAHSQFPFGVNSVGGNAVQKAKSAYLNGAPLEAVDVLPILPFGTPDDTPRCFGYSWCGTTFPASYATGVINEGITATLTANSTAPTVAGGAVGIVSSAAVPALNTYLSGNFFNVIPGKRMWYNIRFSLSTVASTAVVVGFVNSFAGADLTTLPTDGIFILKPLAATDFTAHVRKASTSTTIVNLLAAVGDAALTNTTNVDLGILVDSGSDSGLLNLQGAVSFYANGKFAGQVSGTDPNLPLFTTGLAYCIAMNSTGGAQTMTVTQSMGMEEQ
jgi:hypothetical protein